jgi:molybdopterin synthase catalytic subunit
MQVNVRPFAGLYQLIGEREVQLEVPEGATVTALRLRLADVYPVAKPFLETLVVAVDEEYVPGEYILREGERVAMIPPVSGGAAPCTERGLSSPRVQDRPVLTTGVRHV